MHLLRRLVRRVGTTGHLERGEKGQNVRIQGAPSPERPVAEPCNCCSSGRISHVGPGEKFLPRVWEGHARVTSGAPTGVSVSRTGVSGAHGEQAKDVLRAQHLGMPAPTLRVCSRGSSSVRSSGFQLTPAASLPNLTTGAFTYGFKCPAPLGGGEVWPHEADVPARLRVPEHVRGLPSGVPVPCHPGIRCRLSLLAALAPLPPWAQLENGLPARPSGPLPKCFPGQGFCKTRDSRCQGPVVRGDGEGVAPAPVPRPSVSSGAGGTCSSKSWGS